jgi:hypothetical protein
MRAAWRSLRSPNRFVLGCLWSLRSGRVAPAANCADEIPTNKKPASDRSNGTIRAMLEAARGLPDLLKARREAMEARWRGKMAARRT